METKFSNWCKRNEHYLFLGLETLIVTVLTVSPTIISIVCAKLYSKYSDLTPYYKSGEILLYAVSFFCAAFLVFNAKKRNKRDLSSTLNGIVVVGVLICAGSFGSLISSNGTQLKIDEVFLKWLTRCAIIISLIVFIYSQFVANKKPPDVAGTRQEEQNIIMNNVS